MPTKKPKPDLVEAADDFARKYEDVFGDEDPQDIINELRGDGDVPGDSMNSSGESAAREQWIRDAIAEIEYEAYESNTVYKDSAFDTEKAIDVLARHYAARAREVQELVKAATRAVNDGGQHATPTCDCTTHHGLRTALAPFAAKGETE